MKRFISILIDVLVLSILALILSRMSRIRLKFAPSFNIAVHGITLSVLLNLKTNKKFKADNYCNSQD